MMKFTESLYISKTFIKCKVTPGTYNLYVKVYSLLQMFINVAVQLHNVAQHNITTQHKIAIHHKNAEQSYNSAS